MMRMECLSTSLPHLMKSGYQSQSVESAKCKVELEKQWDRHSCQLKDLNTREMKQRLDESQQWELQLPQLPKLNEFDVESDDNIFLPKLSDRELGGDEVERNLFTDDPTPTKLEFNGKDFSENAPHLFVEDVPPVHGLPQEEA